MQQALALLDEVRALWQRWLDRARRVAAGDRRCRRPVFAQLQDHRLRASLEDADPASRCRRSSPAARSRRCSTSAARIHKQVLRGRVWVALHMHAGDGNVHTNIPVNSDNYAMLQTAHEAVARIMALARRLGGVISGEHGIGITKLEFLTDDELQAFADYKPRIDPEGPLQQGQAAAPAASQATPARRRIGATRAARVHAPT